MENFNPSPALVHPAIKEQLERTQPWMRFLGIMSCISLVLMALAGVLFLILGGVALAGHKSSPQGPGVFFAMGAFYFVLSIVYIFPTILLLRAAKFIRQLTLSNSPDDAVSSLDNQRKLWKFFGITVIIIMVIYVLAIIAAIAYPGMLAIQQAAKK
jgi:hypothetical protein